MGEFYETVSRHSKNVKAMARLSAAEGLSGRDDVAGVFEMAAKTVVDGFVETVRSKAGEDLYLAARALRWAERDDPSTIINGKEHRLGPDMAKLIFGGSLLTVRSGLATRAALTDLQAQSIIETTSIVALACLLADRPPGLDLNEFLAPLRAEGGLTVEESTAPKANNANQLESTPIAGLTDSSADSSVNPQQSSAGSQGATGTKSNELKSDAATGKQSEQSRPNEKSPPSTEQPQEASVSEVALDPQSEPPNKLGPSSTVASKTPEVAKASTTKSQPNLVEQPKASKAPATKSQAEPVEQPKTAKAPATKSQAEPVEQPKASKAPATKSQAEPVEQPKASKAPIPTVVDEQPRIDQTRSTQNAGVDKILDDSEGSRGRGPLIALGAVALLLLLGGAAFFMSRPGGETEATDSSIPDLAATDDSTVPDNVVESDRSDELPEPNAQDSSSDETTAVGSNLVSLSIPMVDIENPTSEATGVLDFEFDTVTGEVCYEVASSNIDGPYRSHIHVGGAGVKGGIVVDLGPLESGATGCVDNLPADTQAILADPASHYAELHDVSEEFTIRGQLSDAVEGDIVSISVPMTDVEGIAGDAEGLLEFDFDTVTGEVCYEISSINIDGPYRSHIHVGGQGVKGGIVVDLGPQESGASGCVDNLPADTQAILADRSGHYAELHDVTEEFTIRGQLSDSITPDGGVDAETDVDGARILLDGGTIFLEGEVPDQATFDEIVASMAGVDSTTSVVNNLQIVDGAPLPSGKVLIADAVFFDSNSDQLRDLDQATLTALTALAQSGGGWLLTVVGHTDDVGPDVYNLELSLRRATALRDVLAAQGIPNDSVRVRGAGETAPIGDNSTEAGRAQNRRIEFEFTPSE